ncbi:hypothetical protein [Serratia proteamaculans]|uniref:hypothetical protein n=1 Tax=Serratia proteamaculans TaxID=28151 RepID=UPI0010EC231A|nr:hypothetical protein [Serratia proteamaculans]RYM54947.1 hypothetical protein BSQ96_08995 [Serratia proteamaculans]
MRAETEVRVEAFRRALKLAADERSGEPVPHRWRNDLKAFPRGCCELASQTLVKYLRDHDPNLFPYVIALQWIENGGMHGHVFVALDGYYIDLTLDQFPGHKKWIGAEPVESGGQMGALLQKVRRLEGAITTREVTLDVIPGNGHQLYDWLKTTADSLLGSGGQAISSSSMPLLVSTEILPQYRDRTVASPSDKATHVTEKKNQKPMTHEGIITEYYRPREVRLRQTRTQWISECGLRFRKSTGAAVGSGVWSSHRLDLSSIREIRPDE